MRISPLVIAELDAQVPLSGCDVSCGASSRAVRSQTTGRWRGRSRARGTVCRTGRAPRGACERFDRRRRPERPSAGTRDRPRRSAKRIRGRGSRSSIGCSSCRSTRAAASRSSTRRSRTDRATAARNARQEMWMAGGPAWKTSRTRVSDHEPAGIRMRNIGACSTRLRYAQHRGFAVSRSRIRRREPDAERIRPNPTGLLPGRQADVQRTVSPLRTRTVDV